MIQSGDLLGSVYATDIARMGAPDSSGAFVNLEELDPCESAGIRSVLARRPRYTCESRPRWRRCRLRGSFLTLTEQRLYRCLQSCCERGPIFPRNDQTPHESAHPRL